MGRRRCGCGVQPLRRCELLGIKPCRRPGQRQRPLALERPAHVHEREPDHVPVGVVFNRESLIRFEPMS